MSCLGVHFSVEEVNIERLRSLSSDEERLEYVQEHLEEELYGTVHSAASDKAWDAMHRALADGYLTWDGGEYPLNHTILGGELLYSGDDYIMSLKSPSQVVDIANSLEALDMEAFRKRYFAIPSQDYDVDLDDEDFEYTWSWFEDVQKFYRRAATDERYVLFTADQ